MSDDDWDTPEETNKENVSSVNYQNYSGKKSFFKHAENNYDTHETSGRTSSNNTCFNCGEEGHRKSDCPNERKSGSGGGNTCFNCGEEGHRKSDCPNERKSGSGGGNTCFNCGEEGHRKSDCPNERKAGGGHGNTCFNCGEEGHRKSECTNERKPGVGGDNRACFNCGEEGHQKFDCPNKQTNDPDKKPAVTYEPVVVTDEQLYDNSTKMQSGIDFDKYDDIPVKITSDILDEKDKQGISNFMEANLKLEIMKNIDDCGYNKPTPIQKFALPLIQEGHDIMGCAQTGSGKTAAFLLPIINSILSKTIEGSQFSEVQTPKAVIVAPTRELVVQIHKEARKYARGTRVNCVVAYGGTSMMHCQRQLQAGTQILIASPGRLEDIVMNRKWVSLSKVEFLVLDEADRMLDMGFKDQVEKIVSQCPEKGERQTLMFSATFPSTVQVLAKDFLVQDYAFITVGRVGAVACSIEQTVLHVSKIDKRDKVVDLLNNRDTNDKFLIFVETQRTADFLAAYFSNSDLPSTSIHGAREQYQREDAIRDFTSGKHPILVATSVASRGLDIPGVTHVINYDLPKDHDDYVHRIGRTGRCGNRGKAIAFFDPEQDANIAPELVKNLVETQQLVPEFLNGVSTGASIGFSNDCVDKRINKDFESGNTFANAANNDDEEW